VVRDCIIETLACPDAMLVINETGFLCVPAWQQGKASCGVACPYTGSAGKITNRQTKADRIRQSSFVAIHGRSRIIGRHSRQIVDLGIAQLAELVQGANPFFQTVPLVMMDGAFDPLATRLG
jgi:hypothetical protein